MIDLLIFSPGFYRGGAQRVTIDIANIFAQKGKKVHIIVLNLKNGFGHELNSKVKVINLNCKQAIFSIKKLSNYLVKTNPKVFFSTQPHCTAVSWIATKICSWKGKFIARETNTKKKIEGRKILFKDRLISLILSYIYLKIDCVIAPSKGLAQEINGNTKILYNLTEIEKIKKNSKKKLPKFFNSKKKFILGVGRFVDQKRFFDLINAFSKIAHKKNLNLVLLGEGELDEDLKNLTRFLKLEKRIFFPGFDNNPFKYMAKCEIFVLSSAWEGMPNVLIQALICGSKIISTNCPHGPKEILHHGKYGSLVQVGDINALSQAIKKNLYKPKPKVPKKFLNQFSIVKQYKKLYSIFFED